MEQGGFGFCLILSFVLKCGGPVPNFHLGRRF